jgi:hypothetical protein
MFRSTLQTTDEFNFFHFFNIERISLTITANAKMAPIGGFFV